ncbi:penicillin-binding protein 1A [Burkholderiaceae bacterium DAT-1]|nr:penicillin-binding protein 1A [Burkholderiaceae bacterium DAT-1]
MTKRWLLLSLSIIAALFLVIASAFGVAIAATYPRLPSLEAITDYRPKIPLRIYTADGVQIGEFGEERRAFVPIGQIPQLMKQAVLSAEDERFYEHGGLDYLGILRTMVTNLLAGHIKGGASTITQQVARNFYLSNEQTWSRKFKEMLLTFKIEKNLSKDQIFELYLNQIYLGQRAYGFASAAQVYYGKTLDQLTPAEAAMLAGLPKAPSAYNPVVNPKRAQIRQRYVIGRMRELKFISEQQFQAAINEPMRLKRANDTFPVHGEYVAEMVRQVIVEKYKDAAYTQGFNVYTTLLANHQNAAYEGARKGVVDYDHRHGYRGPEGFVDLAKAGENRDEWLEEQLSDVRDANELIPAIVLSADLKQIKAYVRGTGVVSIGGDGMKFALRALSDKLAPTQRIRPGAIIRVQQADGGWQVTQLPQVEVAFVSVDPQNGAIRALVGGFDFSHNNFNHVTQAWRQPGSSFKPFIYSAGIERGFTPITLINDAPLMVDPATVGGQKWDPKNSDGKFDGMMTMRNALTHSKNLVSIRVLQAITPEYAQSYVGKFGFTPEKHPAYLTMALGAGEVTPLQMAEAYSVFANTGFRVRSYFIDRIEDSRKHVLARTVPEVAGQTAPRTLPARNAYIVTNMMHDVTRFGTAASLARDIKRDDLAGKTGTTTDAKDAWFAGFQPNLVGIAWIGFDKPQSLGGRESGGQAALPIWTNYMRKVLQNVPEYAYPLPEGVTAQGVEINGRSYTEYFYSEFLQTNPELGLDNSTSGNTSQGIDENVKNQLF